MDLAAAVGTGLLALVGLFLWLSSGTAIIRLVKQARDRSVAQLTQGPELVTLRGRVVPSHHGTVTSPVTHAPAVWFVQVLWTTIGKKSSPQSFSRGVPFYLDDGSGQPALVIPDNAKTDLRPRFSEGWDGMGNHGSPIVDRWRQAHGPTDATTLRSGPYRRLEETVLSAGEAITVLGTARRGPDGAVVVRNEQPPTGQLHFLGQTRADLIGNAGQRGKIGKLFLLTSAVLLVVLLIAGHFTSIADRKKEDALATERRAKQEEADAEQLTAWKKIQSDTRRREAVAITSLEQLKKKGRHKFYWLEPKADPGGEKSFKPCAELAEAFKSFSGAACQSTDYIVGVRKRSIGEPAQDANGKYDGGRFIGDALVYEMKSGEYLGGIALTVVMAAQTGSGGDAAAQKRLFLAVEERISDEIGSASK